MIVTIQQKELMFYHVTKGHTFLNSMTGEILLIDLFDSDN